MSLHGYVWASPKRSASIALYCAALSLMDGDVWLVGTSEGELDGENPCREVLGMSQSNRESFVVWICCWGRAEKRFSAQVTKVGYTWYSHRGAKKNVGRLIIFIARSLPFGPKGSFSRL